MKLRRLEKKVPGNSAGTLFGMGNMTNFKGKRDFQLGDQKVTN